MNVPLFAALDLGPAHWLACAGIDIHSLIHKSILRKALRAATLTNSNGYGGGEDEDEEGESSATIGSRQLLSSQQIAAAAASASILSPAPFSGPFRQSFTGRMNTPGGGGGGGGDSSSNGGRGGSGISRIFSPLSTSSASLSPLASSSSMIRSGRVILCRSFLGNVLDLCSGTNMLEASQGARHLPTSFYGDPLLTPAGQAAAALAHSTSQRLLSRHTTDNKGEGGTVKKTATPSVTTSATSFDSQQPGSSKGGGSGGQLNGAQIFGAEGGERLWAVLDPHLLVPEYIVDFSYVFEGEDDAEKEAAAAVTAIMLDSSSSLSSSSSSTTTATISEEKNRIEKQKQMKMKKNLVPSSSEVPISTSPSSCAIPTPSSSSQSASISSVSSTSSPPPSSPSSKNKETTRTRRQAGDMENTSPPLAPSSRSDLANSLLRLHSICCSPTSLSKSSSSNFATLSNSERSQLSSSNLGQTFQAAAAMLRKARSMRSGGGVGGGGGAIIEASVSSLTLALHSIANLISFDRSSSEQQQQQQQQRTSLLSLLLPPAEDVELRALLPSLLSFSRLIVDVASLYLGGGPSRVVTDGSEYMNDTQVNTSKSGGMGEIRYPLNSTLIDSVALDALSMLPRTSPFESRIGKDNNEGDYNNRRRSLLSTPPWLTAITSSSLLSSSHWLPQELSIVTVNSTGDTIDHIESILKKMDPLEMFIQSNPSLMLASSSSSSSTSLTTKVSSLPLSQPLTLCLSASALANLTSLCLDGCGLSGRLSLYGIASCSGLRRISLAFNRLTHLDGLSSCAALHEVDASYNLVKSLLIDEGATTIKKEKKVMNGTISGATDRTRRGKKNAWGRVNNKIENEDEEEEEDKGEEIGGDSGRKNRVYSDTDALERSNSTAYESVLGACHFLHDLRLSHNLFSNISDVLLGIMRRPMLRVLDLRGNPFLLPSSERSKSSYLPRVLSSLPGLGVLDECSITEADWRLVEANRCKFKRRSVLQQPELIARIAVGGEKASRDAFLFQPIARADEEEEEEDDDNDDDDDDDGWKVRSHITHNDDVDNDDIYRQSLRECGKDCDKALAVSSVVFDSIAAEAMRLLDRHPPLRLPHSLDLSGMYISGCALRTKQAAYTLAAMPSLKKLSLSNNAIKSLVEENDVASHHHHHQRDHHFTLSALSMATNLTELDLHNCNLRVLAHSHSAMVHAKHVKMSNGNNSIPAAASVGAAEASAVVTSSSSSSSMMTSGMFDLLTDLSSLVSNIVRVHREVDASSSTPSAHHDHHHSFDDENIIVSDLTAERIKRFPLWGFAMTKGATGICALISSEEQQNGGRDTSDRRQSALDVYPSSSSSSSVSLTIDLDRDDHSRFTESDSPSPFLTPIVVASTVDAEDDDENNENNINLIISGKSRDAFDEAATVVTTSREFAIASHQKQQLQQQQLQQRLSSRQGSSGTSRKSSSTTTPQPIEASSSSSSPINSPFIVAGLPGLPHTSFSPVDLSTPPSLLLPNPPSSSSSIRFVKFLPLIPLVSPLLASGSNLRRLDLSYNELCDKAVIDARLDLLPNLITLSLERNKLRTFDGVKGCSGLLELYLGLNEIGGGGGGGEEGSERRRTRGLGLKKNDDDDDGDGDDGDGDDEEGRQSDATTSSPFSNSEESLRHSSSMFAIPLGYSSSFFSTLLSSTASPLLRMLRAVASEPVSIISEGGTVSPRNVMNVNAGGNGSGVISTAPLPLLSILDLTGNPIASVKGYREATLRRARKLRVLDGVSVSAADLAAAGSDRLNGKLTVEWLEDRAAALAEEEGGGIQWADVPLTDGDEDLLDASLLPRHPLSLTLDLDYASAHIRDVELLSPLSLPHVRSISLDHNQLSDEGIGGLKLLLYSPTLKSLSLNHNKVVSLLPALGREKGAAAVVGGGGGGGAPEEIASTIISLLPQLSRESKIWGSVYGKNKSVASTNHETRDEEMVSLQRGDEGSGNGREGGGGGDGRGRGGVDEVLSREINKSGANSNSFLRAGSGGAAAAASILAAMEKDYEGGGGGGGGIMNEDVRRNHQYQVESSSRMNEEERRTSSSFFLHQSHSKGAPHPPPNHLSPNYNHNITLINSRDIYCRLERLHLVHNGIVSMEGLGLLHLPKLREIDLSHNEIAKVGGLAGCKSLSSITLNGNVIRALDLVYLSRSCPLLTHLSVMDNGLRSLTGNAAVSSANSISSFGHLRQLLSVNLSSNRISDVNELEPLLLFAASSLITSVSFALNPVSRRPNYRSALLARLPELLSIDGREVLMEERGGGVGQGGGLVATHFLHQQGHGGAQQHQSQQQQTNSQLFKLFGQVGQTSGQLLGQQQQQQQQHQRIIQSSQPLYQQASIHMGPLALSMVAALNNVKGGEVTGGNGNGGVNENIVKESSSVSYSGGATTFSTANGGQMLSSTSVATERLPKELTLSSKLLTKDHSSSSSSSSGAPAAASAAQTQSSSSLSSSSSSSLLSSSSSSLFGLPSSSDRLLKDSPSPYGVIPHGNTAGAQSAPSTTAGAQSTPILTRGGGESSSVNVGHDALFGAVVNHYKERGNGGVGGGGGGGGGSGGGTSSYYVMHRGNGVGKGSLQDKEKSSSSGLSSSRSEGGGLSLTTISLSLPKTGKKNGKSGGNNGKKVDR